MDSIKLYSGNLNTALTFRAEPEVKTAQAASTEAIHQQPASDQLVKTEAKKERVGLVQGFKNFVAGVKKFFIGASEYTKATFAGIGEGFLAGGAVRFGLWVGRTIKNHGLKKQGKELKKLGTFGKTLAALVGIATFGASLYKASLNVSERTAGVDHRYGTGHRVEK